jgi:hypothetical protein
MKKMIVMISVTLIMFVCISCSTPTSISQSSTVSNETTTVTSSSVSETSVETTVAATTTESLPRIYTYVATLQVTTIHSFSDLDAKAQAVVKATLIETTMYDKISSISIIRIDEVLKSDGIIQAGKTYKLIEHYIAFIRPTNPGVLEVFSYSNAFPLIQSHQYLLFLEKSPAEYADYAMVDSVLGKYPLTELTIQNRFRNLSSEQMEFANKGQYENADSIAADAFDKYMEK